MINNILSGAFFMFLIVNILSAQNFVNSIHSFLAKQPTQIIYWESKDSKYFDRTDFAFQPIKLEYQNRKFQMKTKYSLATSNLKKFYIGTFSIKQISTFFYYIPDEMIKTKSLKLSMPNSSSIDFYTNDVSFVKSDSIEIVCERIKKFENIIFEYNKLKIYNGTYISLVKTVGPFLIVPSAVLGYILLKNDYKFFGYFYSGSAVISTLVFTIQFPIYIRNLFRLNSIEENLNASIY